MIETKLDIVALTLWGEGRGEGRDGQIAIWHVINNRANASKTHPCYLFGDGTMSSACLVKYQFSCWNANDPNRDKILAMNANDPGYIYALESARRAAATFDPTSGATHYKVSSIPWPKDWGVKVDPLITIGHHSFYVIK